MGNLIVLPSFRITFFWKDTYYTENQVNWDLLTVEYYSNKENLYFDTRLTLMIQ